MGQLSGVSLLNSPTTTTTTDCRDRPWRCPPRPITEPHVLDIWACVCEKERDNREYLHSLGFFAGPRREHQPASVCYTFQIRPSGKQRFRLYGVICAHHWKFETRRWNAKTQKQKLFLINDNRFKLVSGDARVKLTFELDLPSRVSSCSFPASWIS